MRIALRILLPFLVVISAVLMTASQALAMQTAVSDQQPVTTINIQPDMLPVHLSINSAGKVSFGFTNTIEIEELGFVVTVSTDTPLLSPQALQKSLSASDLDLIIRHMQSGSLVDSSYLLKNDQAVQGVEVTGTITHFLVRRVQPTGYFLVFLDASTGPINTTFQGVSAGATSAARIGCPSSTLLAWSIDLQPEDVKEIAESPCTFHWNNSGSSITNWVAVQTSGNDSLICPIGIGAATIQMSFPGWHFWEDQQTITCDGKNPTNIDDLQVADQATITFTSPDPSSTSTMQTSGAQTCVVTGADGINIRMDATTQSAWVAHYSSGTVLSLMQVVHGEFVNGNDLWGKSAQGHFYSLSLTSRPHG